MPIASFRPALTALLPNEEFITRYDIVLPSSNEEDDNNSGDRKTVLIQIEESNNNIVS